MSGPIVIGLDLGGTFIRAGLFHSSGELHGVRQAYMPTRESVQKGLEQIAALVIELTQEHGSAHLTGIGIGATGPIDARRGCIQNPFTLPGWEDVPIVDWLQDRFDLPVLLENDADMAALGEYWQGAGMDVTRLAVVTVGTGIGTACILDGKIYRGLEGVHPEIGHHVIDPSGPLCYCGAKGCWEVLASGTAIARTAHELLQAYPSSILWSKTAGGLEQIHAHMVAEAAKEDDPLAVRVIEQAGRYFSLGLVNLINFFVPEMIVLGGSVMNSLSLFMPFIERTITRHNVMVPATRVRIIPAKLGIHAGLYGAAFCILQKLEMSRYELD
jgi:glucokinase